MVGLGQKIRGRIIGHLAFMRDKNITIQIHSDAKKRRFALLFVAGDLRR
jgi:hypothetical protein